MGAMTYGEIVRTLRTARGFTQGELAGLIGEHLGSQTYNQSNLPRIEADEYDVPLSLMQAIAKAFNVTVGDMMSLMDHSAADPQFAQWIRGYRRLNSHQRTALIAMMAAEEA